MAAVANAASFALCGVSRARRRRPTRRRSPRAAARRGSRSWRPSAPASPPSPSKGSSRAPRSPSSARRPTPSRPYCWHSSWGSRSARRSRAEPGPTRARPPRPPPGAPRGRAPRAGRDPRLPALLGIGRPVPREQPIPTIAASPGSFRSTRGRCRRSFCCLRRSPSARRSRSRSAPRAPAAPPPTAPRPRSTRSTRSAASPESWCRHSCSFRRSARAAGSEVVGAVLIAGALVLVEKRTWPLFTLLVLYPLLGARRFGGEPGSRSYSIAKGSPPRSPSPAPRAKGEADALDRRERDGRGDRGAPRSPTPAPPRPPTGPPPPQSQEYARDRARLRGHRGGPLDHAGGRPRRRRRARALRRGGRASSTIPTMASRRARAPIPRLRSPTVAPTCSPRKSSTTS